MQKKISELLDHTRTALENDRSIDREEHATISTPDLLALVQLGEICENVCATIGSGPIPLLPPPRTAFSFKSSFNQERVFVSRKITSLPTSGYHEDTMLVFYHAKSLTVSVINTGRAKMSYGCLCFEQLMYSDFMMHVTSDQKYYKYKIMNVYIFKYIKKVAEDSVFKILMIVNDLFPRRSENIFRNLCIREKQLSIRARNS